MKCPCCNNEYELVKHWTRYPLEGYTLWECTHCGWDES